MGIMRKSVELRNMNIGTELYVAMYITIALSSFYYSSILTVFNPPVVFVAVIPQIVFFCIGGIKIFFIDEHSKKEWIAIISGLFLAIFMLISSGLEVGIMFFYVSLFAAKGINFRRFLKAFLMMLCPVFIITFFLSLIGLIPDRVYGDRHSFGISYPTDFAAYVFYFFMAFSCFIKRHRAVYAIIAAGLAFFIIKYPIARLDFGLIILVALFFIIKDMFPGFYKIKIIRCIFISSSVILCALAILISLFYSEASPILYNLDSIFSTRFSLSHRAFAELPLSILGSKITLIGNPQADPEAGIYPFFLDIFYIMSFFRFGAVGLLAVVASMVISEKHADETDNVDMMIVFLLIAGTSFVDHHYFELSFNPFLAYAGVSLYAILGHEKSGKQ